MNTTERLIEHCEQMRNLLADEQNAYQALIELQKFVQEVYVNAEKYIEADQMIDQLSLISEIIDEAL